ncbi:MAG TPA: DUF1015 family protein [Rhodothermales bacterium]|nr:DUF1015 family protein [Rhodothermales bacterium]
MAILHPFRAFRPVPQVAAQVACVPYDVINTAEARALASGNPLSFLHIVRPEINFSEETDEHADIVYETGAAKLAAWKSGLNTLQEAEPSLYLYRLVMNGRSQTGIFGCVAVSDYDKGTILRHELTRPDKEDDRTRHILTQSAHAEPVMLTFRTDEVVGKMMDETQRLEPIYDFVAPDGIAHTVWKVENPDGLVARFREIPFLYVADGHHRCKAASRAVEALNPLPDAEANYFPAVLFPMNQMAILPYNRIVYKIPMMVTDFLAALQPFDLRENAVPTPERKGDVSMLINGKWYGITLPETKGGTVADTLDVALLGEYVLAPLLGIRDARTDKNINFVGGIRGTGELEKLVSEGTAQVAFSMYPTQIEELLAVSDAGLLMPPKSTWFEPKLRSGLLVHEF